jgi:methylated-DNA-[protein]-cysteine S-methyltransferase
MTETESTFVSRASESGLERELRRTAESFELPRAPDIEPAAEAAGIVDIAYATQDSPVGRLLLAATPRGLVRIAYLDEREQGLHSVLEELARRVSPRILAAPRRLDEDRRQLEQYFTRDRKAFDLELDWRLCAGFARRVLAVTSRIPYGAVATYKQVATEAGSPRGSRAAGNALGSNPLPIVVPCHRVVHSAGGLGGYTGGLERKEWLLGVEGTCSRR